jgi:uncharacterized protein (TIGR01777 family)
MKITVVGGSGFIGKHLIQKLLQSNHDVTLLSRHPASTRQRVPASVAVKAWTSGTGLIGTLEAADAVVNLAGESIGSKRWSAPQKKEILLSRIETTKAIVDALAQTSKKPSVLFNASAVGYYGNVENDEVTESYPAGNDFLADVCIQWENEAKKAESSGIRVVLPRTGIVLAKNGGALQKMLLPFKLFAGGSLGSGKQWFPWIHVEDEVGAMVYALEHENINGPVNLAAPGIVTMKQFSTALGKAMHRPSWAPVPSFVLKAVLGEMADALVLGGQKVIPKKLLESGYQFRHSRLDAALADILV